MSKFRHRQPRNGFIPRAYFTTRNGRRVYAKDYGYKCWPIGRKKPR